MELNIVWASESGGGGRTGGTTSFFHPVPTMCKVILHRIVIES